MTKKVVKKKKVNKSSKTKSTDSLTNRAVERLIDSNIALQHKMADVLMGVKELNNNVSSLVHVFKTAGEHIKSAKYEDPMISKMDALLDQNQRITKALAMLEKMVEEKTSTPRRNPLEENHY